LVRERRDARYLSDARSALIPSLIVARERLRIHERARACARAHYAEVSPAEMSIRIIRGRRNLAAARERGS